jgi:L-fuculose-phosphate aldolase
MAIPAVHYMIAVSGGDIIPCAAYATFGTEELSRNAVEALADRTACLLANHGMIATGPSLAKAMWLATEVETLARQYFNTLLIGGPNILPPDEVARVIGKLAGYGIRPK